MNSKNLPCRNLSSNFHLQKSTAKVQLHKFNWRKIMCKNSPSTMQHHKFRSRNWAAEIDLQTFTCKKLSAKSHLKNLTAQFHLKKFKSSCKHLLENVAAFWWPKPKQSALSSTEQLLANQITLFWSRDKALAD